MPTVRSLEFKQVSLPRPVTNEGSGISGRGKDEKPNAREQAAFAGSADTGVVRFTDGTAEVSEEVAAQLVEHYPQSIFVVEEPAKG